MLLQYDVTLLCALITLLFLMAPLSCAPSDTLLKHCVLMLYAQMPHLTFISQKYQDNNKKKTFLSASDIQNTAHKVTLSKSVYILKTVKSLPIIQNK